MYFGMIPFLKNNDLSARERYLLMYFLHCEQMGVNPDYPQIIEETGISKAALTAYLSNLRQNEYIWIRKNKRFNEYHVNHHKVFRSAAS
jgi:DNA-binding MarR family transcriptional regulator